MLSALLREHRAPGRPEKISSSEIRGRIARVAYAA